MSEKDNKSKYGKYSDDFVARMKDFAVIGLYPTQIAERLELVGIERTDFLRDVSDRDHPLSRAYYTSREHYEVDMEAALAATASSGDAYAIQVALNAKHQREVDNLTYELFGV